MGYFYELSLMGAGIGLFLLGTNFLEEALSKLAGRSFKVFLKTQTNNKLKAVASGAIVTAVLQSSSVVSLMVLAFVGSGVLAMQNALSVILGANIGTTLTSWIVATLGFKINIESIAYPLVGVFGIAMALFQKEGKGYQWSKFFVGFGLLFVGLSFMKSGFEVVAQEFDFSVLDDYPLIIFVLVGFVLTSLIQSSSATVAITLTALNSDAVTLLAAMAIVLGSEVGTTIKLLIASV
ncbi:MAG TPA: sodium:phosphate symporter, partial [Cytophagales bacterium]|nr:sodium:phosphate symporter [Cytophagales bacterium]